MWEKFKLRLGKLIQNILNKFRKKESESFIGKQAFMQDGELYINGESFGKIMSVEKLSLDEFEKTDFPAKLKRDVKWECSFDMEMSKEEKELLENLANTAYPILPRLIKVPTLLVSLYADYEYDSRGVDISQLDETGIAHYWITTTKSLDWWNQELYGDDEEEYCVGEDGCATAYVQNAILYEWEDGHWTWSF